MDRSHQPILKICGHNVNIRDGCRSRKHGDMGLVCDSGVFMCSACQGAGQPGIGFIQASCLLIGHLVLTMTLHTGKC